jgi:hypothetical protein
MVVFLLSSNFSWKFKGICFSSFCFPLPLFSYGPSPADHLPSSPFLLIPWQPSRSPSSLSFFSFCSPAQPAVLLSRPLLSSARARPTLSSPGPSARPLPPPLPIALTGGARLSGPSPPPHRTRARVRLDPAPSSPSPPRAPTPRRPRPLLFKRRTSHASFPHAAAAASHPNPSPSKSP